MICQECQEQKAKVHVTKIVNGKKREIYLCEECAQENEELDFGVDFSFNNLLTGLLNNKLHSHHQINISNKQIKCEECGLNYKEFSKSGRLGCNQCYSYFGDKIDRILRRIHSSDRHTGKVPKRVGELVRVKRKIEELKKKMDQAVEKEEFERAAEFRDKIKELKDDFEE